jgi:Uma2 family endonuclease
MKKSQIQNRASGCKKGEFKQERKSKIANPKSLVQERWIYPCDNPKSKILNPKLIDETLGLCFASSTGFTLLNGAVRSPTASWVKREKWEALTKDEREKFAPGCPNFVVEFLTDNDNLRTLRQKMQEYLDNGTSLGWLINTETWQVEISRPNQDVEILQSPATLSGENVLPGFVFFLEEMISIT